LEGHTNVIQALDVSEDGEIVASVSFDHTIRVWKKQDQDEIDPSMLMGGANFGVPGNYELLQLLEGHTKGVTTVKISKTKDFIISGGRDSTIRFWKRTIDE
jgi:WD40 repeat protein